MLRRVHLFEFHDLTWFPAIFREALTEWLRVLWSRVGAFEVLAPLLAGVLRESGATRVVDLCSGGGGPLIGIQRELETTEGGRSGFKAIVTDKFPNLSQMEELQRQSKGMIEARLTSVDATQVPRDLNGFRTLFNSFHHFRHSEARQILKDAYEAQQPIGVFEIPNRRLSGIAFSFVATFIGVLLLTPSMRPMRPIWWVFTYLVPVIPFTVAWDGWVSHLRAYTIEELRQMTSDLSNSYRWEIRSIELRKSNFTVTCVLGLPQRISNT
jgi:hypothetical protein